MGDSLFQGLQKPVACNRTGTRNSGSDARERQVARILLGDDLRGLFGGNKFGIWQPKRSPAISHPAGARSSKAADKAASSERPGDALTGMAASPVAPMPHYSFPSLAPHCHHQVPRLRTCRASLRTVSNANDIDFSSVLLSHLARLIHQNRETWRRKQIGDAGRDGVPLSTLKEACTVTLLASRTVFEIAPPSPCERVLSNRRDNLRGVAKRGGLEAIPKRPAAGQVNTDATSCYADARPDLEQLNAQCFDLCGAH